MPSNISRNNTAYYSENTSQARVNLQGAIQTAIKYVNSQAPKSKKAQEFATWVKTTQREYASNQDSWIDAWSTSHVKDMIRGLKSEFNDHGGNIMAESLEASLQTYAMDTGTYRPSTPKTQLDQSFTDATRSNVSTSKTSSHYVATNTVGDYVTGQRADTQTINTYNNQ